MATRWQQNYQIYRRYVRNLALMYQKRQDVKLFIELLLTLTVVVIFGIFAIRPTVVTIISLNKDIATKRETVDILDTKITALSNAQDLFDANRSAIQAIDNAIPDDPFPVVFARQIEGLANRHSLFIIGMNTEDVPLITNLQTAEPENEQAPEGESTDSFPATSESFEFEINLSGDYTQMINFLSDFESLRTPMLTDTLSVQISQGDSPGQLILTLSGRLAYLSNEQ